ncbi:MAG: hypothetical protein HYZ16_11540 [Bacteroidetes bacterium]|nr:hypothetical protein [Bacteroidota bacterium]
MTIHSIIEQRVLRTMTEFTKKSPMGSITTGMLSLIVKPTCGTDEFSELLNHMEHKGLLIGIPKGKTKRWRLD